MAPLPQKDDPTLAAADAALVAAQERRYRAYLGMSAIGDPCSRKLWYQFRWVALADFDAATLKRFADGHATEAVIIDRLKATPGLEVHDRDAEGEQFGFQDLGGHFRGHMDGVVLGLKQAPTTWHVLEIKATEKLTEVRKAIDTVGEKLALARWNATYYGQAVLYMHYAGLTRHWLVASSPGARKQEAMRTEEDEAAALALIAKAERIIFSDTAPDRIGDATNFLCRWCDFAGPCHTASRPWALRNCRTCLHAHVERVGGWRCMERNALLSKAEQERGCPSHRYLPSLVPGVQIDVDAGNVSYALADGSTWVDGGAE